MFVVSKLFCLFEVRTRRQVRAEITKLWIKLPCYCLPSSRGAAEPARLESKDLHLGANRWLICAVIYDEVKADGETVMNLYKNLLSRAARRYGTTGWAASAFFLSVFLSSSFFPAAWRYSYLNVRLFFFCQVNLIKETGASKPVSLRPPTILQLHQINIQFRNSGAEMNYLALLALL